MKNLKTELWAVAVVLLALVLPSCSDGASDLLGGVPAETKGVMVIKPADLAQKSDIKGFLKKMGFRGKDKKTFDAVMELFEEGGIGLDCMVAFEYEEGGYLSFVINDKKKFAEAELIGENTDKNKQDGFVYYEVNGTEGRTNIIVDGRKAWLAFGDTDVDGQIEAVKKFQGLGKDKSVLSIPHFSENMQDGDMNVFLNIEEIVGLAGSKGRNKKMVDMAMSEYGLSAKDIHLDEMMSCRMYMSFAFNKDDLKITSKVFDKEGGNLSEKFFPGTIDTDMLRFFDKKTALVGAVVIPDYLKKVYGKMISSSFYDETQKMLLEQGLENIEGNVAFGVSLSKDFIVTETYYSYYGEVERVPRFNEAALGVTAVVKYKKDMSSMFADFAALSELPVGEDGSVVIPLKDEMALKLRMEGKYLVMSTREATTSPMSDPGLFEGKASAMFLNVAKNTDLSAGLAENFGIDLDLTALSYTDKEQGVFEVKVNNNKKDNVLAYILGVIADTVK